jgi:hypothetical protein
MKRWTVDDLRALDACEEQVAMFAATFPDGATLTLRTAGRPPSLFSVRLKARMVLGHGGRRQ